MKIGYRVTLVQLDNTTGAPVEYANFVSGFLDGATVTGKCGRASAESVIEPESSVEQGEYSRKTP